MDTPHISRAYDTNLQGCRVNSLQSGCIRPRAHSALYVTMFSCMHFEHAYYQTMCIRGLKIAAHLHYDLISQTSYIVSYRRTTPLPSLGALKVLRTL